MPDHYLNPAQNIYVIPSATDLPDVLSRFVLYNVQYDAGSGIGLYYSPDESILIRLREGEGRTSSEISNGVFPVDYNKDPGSFLRYGMVGDGVFVNDTAWGDALDSGHALFDDSEGGTYLINTSKTPLANTFVDGSGIGKTILLFKATSATLFGLLIQNNNIKFSNLTMQMDVNGNTACTSHRYTGACENITFENVQFIGTTVKLGNRAAFVISAAVDHVRYINCKYELLTWGIAKDNSDTSIQRDWQWISCSAVNCTDVFNINSPLGEWSQGKIVDCDFDTISQFSVAFAGAGCNGWYVSGTFRDCELEAVHCEASCSNIDGYITTVRVNKTAGVVGSPAANNGAVQVLTGANKIRIDGYFDLTQNVANSFTGDTHTSTLVDAISIDTSNLTVGGKISGTDILAGTTILTIDSPTAITLSQAATGTTTGAVLAAGSVNGLVCQPGGGTDPFDITMRGTYLCESGTFAALFSSCDNVFIDDPFLTNVSSSSKAAHFIEFSNSDFRGQARFYNPAILLKVNADNEHGGLDFVDLDGDFTSFAWLDTISAARNSVPFGGWRIRRAFTADSSATFQTICPEGTLWDGILSMRFVATGGDFTQTQKAFFKTGGSLTVADVQSNAGGSVDPEPASAPFWRVNGGNLQKKAFHASSLAGVATTTFRGHWFG